MVSIQLLKGVGNWGFVLKSHMQGALRKRIPGPRLHRTLLYNTKLTIFGPLMWILVLYASFLASMKWTHPDLMTVSSPKSGSGREIPVQEGEGRAGERDTHRTRTPGHVAGCSSRHNRPLAGTFSPHPPRNPSHHPPTPKMRPLRSGHRHTPSRV